MISAKKANFDLARFRSLPLPSQSEVTASWRGNFEKPLVSVLCLVYNHRSYLEDAIRGFLIQKTTFPFEVVLHDDASTDGVSDIVRKYAETHSGILKAAIQSENQWSKGNNPLLLSFSYARGEYIALCEGDDFWINANKLESQYRLLKNQKKIKLAFHDGFVLYSNGKLKNYPIKRKKQFYTVSDVILAGGGGCPTASLMVHSEIFRKLPSWFNGVPGGDFYLQMIGSQMGDGALYIDQRMCVYRHMAEDSWSSKKDEHAEKRFQHRMACHKDLCVFMGEGHRDELMVVQSEYAYIAARSLLRKGKFPASISYIKKSIQWKLFSPARQFAVLLLALMRIKV